MNIYEYYFPEYRIKDEDDIQKLKIAYINNILITKSIKY